MVSLIAQLRPLIRPNAGLLIRFAATSLLRSALFVASIFLIREFLAGVLGDEQGLGGALAGTLGPTAALWAVAGTLVLTYVGASLCNYANQICQQQFVKVLELDQMERLIRHLMSLSLPFFDRQTPGDLVQAVREDVSHFRTVVVSWTRVWFEGVLAAGLLATVFWMSPSLAFWSLIALPLAAYPILRIARSTLARSHTVRRRGYRLFDVLLEVLRGIRVIKAFQGEGEEARTVLERGRAYFDELIELVRVRSFAEVILESLGGLSLVVVIIIGGFQVMDGRLGWPSLLAFLMGVRALHGPLNQVNANYLQIQRFGASVQRIRDLLQEQPEIRDAPDAVPLRSPPARIRFENVGFRHGSTHALRGLSFEVGQGETIGIAGPSGAGKTTLLNLVGRFYDPSDGRILIDGVDLRQLKLRDVHAALAIVTQEPFLFAASVLSNIRCGRGDASDAEVEEAARSGGIHDEIAALPDGYATPIGPGGHGLSLGQAQRITIARALLKNAPLLLLDEATSSLDSIAEARVQQAVDRALRGRTSFVVAHRLSTLRGADRILVLSEGQQVALAPHDELLHSCELYRQMWEAQQLGAGAPSAEGEAEALASAR